MKGIELRANLKEWTFEGAVSTYKVYELPFLVDGVQGYVCVSESQRKGRIVRFGTAKQVDNFLSTLGYKFFTKTMEADL